MPDSIGSHPADLVRSQSVEPGLELGPSIPRSHLNLSPRPQAYALRSDELQPLGGAAAVRRALLRC